MSDLPESWTWCALSELVANPKNDIVDGPFGSNLKATEYTDQGVPIIRLQNISRNTFIDKNIKYVTPEKAQELKRHSFRSGDIAITKLGDPLGKAAMVPNSFTYGVIVADIVRIRPDSAYVNDRYLTYGINSPLLAKALAGLTKGTTRPRVNLGHIRSLQIPTAPLLEQKRIADKLDTVLTRVSVINTSLAGVASLLKRFRQSVLAAATSGRLTEDWRNSAGSRNVWQTSDVQSVAQVGTGSTPLRSNPGFFSSNGTPWVTSAATSSEIVTEAKEYVTPEAIAAHRLKVFPVGTLLVAMYGEGKTRGQVTQLGIPAAINQACAAIVVDETKMLSDFVKLALQANYLEMRVLAEGGNQPNLNLAKVKGFPLPLPSREEQTEIVRRVETLFAFADRLEARLQTAQTSLDRLTPSLLAKAFRGELVPQDPNDESASELLKRLAAAPATLTSKRRSKTTS